MINIAKKKNVKYNSISEDPKWMSIFFMIFVIGTIAVFLVSMRVEIETDGSCNSGFIGLDIEAYNNIQNKTCTKIQWDNTTQSFEDMPDPNMENLTCFKEDYQLKHIKLKDIDGLNCQGKAKIKMPFILSLFMGGINE